MKRNKVDSLKDLVADLVQAAAPKKKLKIDREDSSASIETTCDASLHQNNRCHVADSLTSWNFAGTVQEETGDEDVVTYC